MSMPTCKGLINNIDYLMNINHQVIQLKIRIFYLTLLIVPEVLDILKSSVYCGVFQFNSCSNFFNVTSIFHFTRTKYNI